MFANILNRFSRQPDEKPDYHSVFLSKLDKIDDYEVLKASADFIAKLKATEDINLESCMQALYAIEEKNKPLLDGFVTKYLTIKDINKKLANELELANYTYLRQIYLAYLQTTDAYFKQDPTLFSKKEAAKLFCRQLTAGFAMAKWRYFDDRPAPVDFWLRVYKTFSHAEMLSILDEKVAIFTSDETPTNCQILILVGQMLSTLQINNYSAKEIQLTEQFLKHWMQTITFEKSSEVDQYQFYCDLTADFGCKRTRLIKPSNQYRLWKTGELIQQMDDFLVAIETNKVSQSSYILQMGKVADTTNLFKKLRLDWAVNNYKRQRRNSSREKVDYVLQVHYGLEQICQHLMRAKKSYQAHADHFDFELALDSHKKMMNAQSTNSIVMDIAIEKWQMVDKSATGFGVNLGRNPADWVKVGKLIGYYSPENKSEYQLAEIKSIKRQADGQYKAGLEVIGQPSQLVQASLVDEKQSSAVSGYVVDDSSIGDNLASTFASILLKTTPSLDTKNQPVASIIMPSISYQRGGQYKVNIDDHDIQIQTGAIVARNAEWVRVAIPALN